ncbi:MAG: hypothetical protein SGARI_001585 [Bacillariaceae sp.]
MFIEFNPPSESDWGNDVFWVPRCLKFLYYCTIVSAFCANMIVVSQTTTLSVLGAGLALRGPDGSMMTATDGLYEERGSVFKTFGIGMACTVGSVVICVWLLLHWEAALCCMVLTLVTGRTIWKNYQRVNRRFAFDASETVDFSDIMHGPITMPKIRKPHGQQQQQQHHSSRKSLNRSSSAPIDIEDGTDDSDEWTQQSERLAAEVAPQP